MPPQIIAHRGMPRAFPENSLPGFAAALALGVDAVELDVHVTADGVPVVHHDPELGRIGAPDAPLRGRPLDALALHELRTHALAPDVVVPTLDEVLELVAGRATVYVEVKAHAAEAPVRARLHACAAWTAVHSFDHRVPRRMVDAGAPFPVGVLSTSYLLDNLAPVVAVGARDLWQHWSMIDAPLVEAAHAEGRRVVAWTVNDAGAMAALAGLGIDGICTDVPDLALRTLAPRARD